MNDHSIGGRVGRFWINGAIVYIGGMILGPDELWTWLVQTAPNYAHLPGLRSTIARGASFIVIAVAPQPASETAHPRSGVPKGSFATSCVMRPSTLSSVRSPSL